MPAVLVLDGDSGQALEVVRSLGREGWNVLAPAGTRSGDSRYTGGQVAIADPDDPLELAAGLGSALREARIDLVAPCSDASAELVWKLRPDGAVLGGDRSAFTLAVDKARTLEAADAAGFPTPRWLAPPTADEAIDFALAIGLPCVVKPRRSFAESNGRLVQRRHRLVADRESLVGALHGLAEADGTLPVVQEHVPGRALAVAAVVAQGRIVASVARETLSFWPVGGGTSVWRRTIAPTAPGVSEAGRFLLELGYTGLAEVEYQVDSNGTPRLMEIGARPFGWLALAIAAGVDLPVVGARAALGEALPEPRGYRVGVEMRWPGGELSRLKAALDPRATLPLDTRRVDLLRSAWPPWRPGMRYDGIDSTDVVPLLPPRVRGLLRRRQGGGPATGAAARQLRPGPRVLYPLKAGMTHGRSAAWLARGRVPDAAAGLRILFYHRISDDVDELAVPVRRFREQVEFLAGEGYRVLDLLSAYDLLARGELPPRTIALSFDDGFRDIADSGLPVLDRHGFTATVFVPTSIIDGSAVFGWYRRQPPVLSWAEIEQLDGRSPFWFEAHSCRHLDLTTLDDRDARSEIAVSKRTLSERLGRPVEAFCYPGGVFGARERELVAATGYRIAASCEPGVNGNAADPFALRRIQIDARDRLLDFRAKLAGGHDTPPPFRRTYRRLRYGGGGGSPRLSSSAR